MASWTNPLGWSVGQAACVQRFDERILDNIDFAGSHNHTGATGDGLATINSGSPNQCVVNYISFIPFCPYAISVATQMLQPSSAWLNGGTLVATCGLGSSALWYMDLAIGTWTISIWYEGAIDGPIISVCIGGASVGQIDTYRSPGSANQLSSASNFSISSSGRHTIKLEATASNISSTGTKGKVAHFELHRLSA